MTVTSKKISTLFLFLPAVLSLVITFVQISGTNTHSRCTLIPASFICLLCAFLQILVLHLYFPLSPIDQGVSSTTQSNGLLVWILIAIMKIPEILTVLGLMFFCGAVLMEMWHSNETTSVIASTCPAHPRRLIISIVVLLGVLYFSMMAIALVVIRERRISPDSERDPSHELTPIQSPEHSELPSSSQTSANPASPPPQPSSPGSPASTSVPKTASATGRIDDLWRKKRTSGHKSYGPRATLAFVLFLAILFVASSFPGLRNFFRGVWAPPSPRSVARTLTFFELNAGLLATGVRVATYLRSILFLSTTYFVTDGWVISRERKTLGKICTNLLIIGYAVVIAALAHRSQLGLYNALIVLDLSWMLAANAILVCVLPVLDGQIESRWHDWLKSFWPTRLRQMVAVLFVSAHLCLTGGFGLYVWSRPFQGPPDSAQQTITYIFFMPISVTSSHLRTASLVLSALAAMPIINVALLTAAVVAVINVVNAFISMPSVIVGAYLEAARDVIGAANQTLNAIQLGEQYVT